MLDPNTPYGDPARTMAEVEQFDEEEMLDGYRDGRCGEPEPKGNRSRSYWHGWRNGAVDGGHRAKDEAQAALAAEAVAGMRRSSAASSTAGGPCRPQAGADHG